jgi:O-antigen ligase/tetratricopeptide (TPR) repeat protein
LFGDADTVRIAGGLGNSSYLGIYSLIHIFIAGLLVVSLTSAKKFTQAWFRYVTYICIALFNIIVLYNTGTRGSFVGLVGGLFVATIIPLWAIMIRKIEVANSTARYVKRTAIILALLIVLGVSSLGLAKNTDFVKKSDLLSRFSSLITLDVKEVFETQGKARVMLWGMAWEGVKERPVLGWGQDNFPFVFAKYYDPKMYGQEQWFDRTHNVFFDWLIAGGILALVGYIVLFIALVYVLWKKTTLDLNPLTNVLEKSVITGLLVGYFIHNLFIFDNLVSYIFFVFMLALAHSLSCGNSGEQSKHKSNIPLIPQTTVALVITVASLVIFVYSVREVVYKPYMAGRTLIYALQESQLASRTPDLEKSKKTLELFEKALSYNTFANVEIRERLSEVAPVMIAPKNDDLLRKYSELVATEFVKAFKETPNDPRPRIFLALYLQKFGLYEQSLPHIEKAIELSPTKQSFIFQKGIVQLSLGRYPDAVATFKQAYDLEPANGEAAVLYALSHIYNGTNKEADKILGDNLEYLTDQRILGVYLEKGMYQKIEQIADMQIKANPNNPQTYLSLAGLYLKMNRRNEAIQQIQKAIVLQPAFKEQGEFYIKEIREGRDPSKQ